MSRQAVPKNAMVGLPPQLDLFERPIIQSGVERALIVQAYKSNKFPAGSSILCFRLLEKLNCTLKQN